MPKNSGQKLKWLCTSDVNTNNLNNKEIMLGMPNCEKESFANHVLPIAKTKFVFLSLKKNVSYTQSFMSRFKKDSKSRISYCKVKK